MKFRPCIDIHNGKVKQIVGGSLFDEKNQAEENYVSSQDAAWFAELYRKKGLMGGHVILLNPSASEFFEETKKQALSALKNYPGGLQAGGGITAQNAAEYLKAGASHVIVTSYVFKEGRVNYENLEKLKKEIGKEHIVIDLSCRKKAENPGFLTGEAGCIKKEEWNPEDYYIVTDRWQNYTCCRLTEETLEIFSDFCDEFLIHAVDVEGKAEGIEENVVRILGNWGKKKTTYAGGVHSFHDLDRLKKLGQGRVDVTIGSALDIFGGSMNFDEVLRYMG